MQNSLLTLIPGGALATRLAQKFDCANAVAGLKNMLKLCEYMLNSLQICTPVSKANCPVYMCCVFVFIIHMFYRCYVALWNPTLQTNNQSNCANVVNI